MLLNLSIRFVLRVIKTKCNFYCRPFKCYGEQSTTFSRKLICANFCFLFLLGSFRELITTDEVGNGNKMWLLHLAWGQTHGQSSSPRQIISQAVQLEPEML